MPETKRNRYAGVSVPSLHISSSRFTIGACPAFNPQFATSPGTTHPARGRSNH